MKARRSKIQADTAPPERWQHGQFRMVPTDKAGVMAQLATPDAFDGYYVRHLLSDNPGSLKAADLMENARRYDAGVRLRHAWTKSGLAPLVTGCMTGAVDGGRDPDLRMVRAMDRSREYHRLIAMVPIPCQPVCIMACCWSAAVGGKGNMVLLRGGLAELANRLEL